MKPTTRFLLLSALVAAATAGPAHADVISNFDFTGPPWTAPKSNNFNTFAANALSVDTDINSTTSPLTNNAGTGDPYDGGGYASFYLRDADLTFDPAIFSTSSTPGVGMNFANADDLTPTNYIAFMVMPDPGYETTYESLEFFSSSFLGDDIYDVELRVVVAGSAETTLGTYQRTMPAGNNNPVEAGSIDFADFTASAPTEFRIYVYNIGQDNGGFRMDDLILNGVTAAGGDPGTVLVDHTFDGVANDVGPNFQRVSNELGTGGSSDLATGLITAGDTSPLSPNSTYGINNVTTVDVEGLDPSAIGFLATFEVSAVGATVANLQANGLFFGVVSGTNATGMGGASLWNNDPNAFGYVAGSGAYGDNVMRQAGTTNFPLFSTPPTEDSFADEFTVFIRVWQDGVWWVTSTGLSTELNQTGSLNTTDFSYADIINDLGLFVSLQGEHNATVDIDRITLTTIPSSEEASLEIISVTKSGDVFTVQFKGTDGETYDLNKSTTLDFSTLDSQDSIMLDGTDTGVLQDSTATEDAAFYRIEQQ